MKKKNASIARKQNKEETESYPKTSATLLSDFRFLLASASLPKFVYALGNWN